MCYSAQVWQAYQDYVRRFGAEISIREFVELYASREKGAKVKTTKAMDDARFELVSELNELAPNHLGLYCSVAEPGTVAVGDAISLFG